MDTLNIIAVIILALCFIAFLTHMFKKFGEILSSPPFAKKIKGEKGEL